MDPQDVSRVQKLCKFASSSLDYDDIDAAIKNLTEALDLLHKSKQKWGKKEITNDTPINLIFMTFFQYITKKIA